MQKVKLSYKESETFDHWAPAAHLCSWQLGDIVAVNRAVVPSKLWQCWGDVLISCDKINGFSCFWRLWVAFLRVVQTRQTATLYERFSDAKSQLKAARTTKRKRKVLLSYETWMTKSPRPSLRSKAEKGCMFLIFKPSVEELFLLAQEKLDITDQISLCLNSEKPVAWRPSFRGQLDALCSVSQTSQTPR